jgi:OPA family glycerol-3-phosphate transporter-like MFS transporter
MRAPQHSSAFRLRRFLNWFPLGLSYAFLYMGRYNLTVAKNALGEQMPKEDFGLIFGVGAAVYGVSFVVNGPLTDRIGGRRTMLIGVLGSITMNVLMGTFLYGMTNWGWDVSLFWAFVFLYAANMYFQSFGAVSIVTVKAPWFHVRERGTFSTIFGVMISLGVYFAFDWGRDIVRATRATVDEDISFFGMAVRAVLGVGGTGVDQNWWVFFVPAMILGMLWIVLLLFLRDRPSHAGFSDFETGEGAVSDDGETLPVRTVFWKIMTHPVLAAVCVIELCSGVMRNGVMQWYTIYATELGFYDDFVITDHWGLTMLLSGVLGATLTGWASDRFFQSRRAPMSAILYGTMFACASVMCLTLGANPWFVGLSAFLISMSVIGVHGIMSGTSTVDFGGSKNAGAAVGIVDGLVYLGTFVQSVAAGYMTPEPEAASEPGNWIGWPLFLVPFALLGLFVSIRIWGALPKRGAAPAREQTETDEAAGETAADVRPA